MRITKILLLLALFPIFSTAQSNEFSLNYSPLSVYRLSTGVEEGLTKTNHYVLGAINFDYYHNMNDWLKLGVSLMFDQETEKGIVNFGHINEYEKTNSVFVFAPQVDFQYLNKTSFKLSSGIGLGYAFNKHSSTEGIDLHEGMNGFTFHVNLISFRWGVKRGLCGYMGLGYKGFLGLGYFMRV